MMKLVMAFVLFFVSCKSKPIPYINHSKWSIENAYDKTILKGNPKEIKETLYTDLTDTSFSALLPGRFNDYHLYHFDEEGNLVFTRIVFDSNYTNDAYYTYGDNGLNYKFISYSSGDTSRSERISKRIGDQTFIAEKYEFGKKVYMDTIVVKNKGHLFRILRYTGDSLLFIRTTEYYKDKLVQTTLFNKKGLERDNYYYSSKGFLDSIVTKGPIKQTGRSVYINDEKGNPVYFEKWEKGERIERVWMKYEYDQKGNWVKQIAKTEGGHQLKGALVEPKFPGYSLLVREIKY